MNRMIFNKNASVSSDENLALFAESAIELTKAYISDKIQSGSVRLNNAAEMISFFNSAEKADSYAEKNAKFGELLAKYCISGTNYEYKSTDQLKNPQITRQSSFKDNFAAVIAESLTPIVPSVVSAAYAGFGDVHNIAWGDSAIFEIESNELFMVNEIAEGVRRGALQRIYGNEVVVNTKNHTISIDMPWYQVAAGKLDFGRWFFRVGMSFAAYFNQSIINKMSDAISKNPNAYTNSGALSQSGLITIGQRVQAANGGLPVSIWGTKNALAKVKPTIISGITYDLGERLTSIGYLDVFVGFPLIEIGQALVPHTVNTTATFTTPDDVLYLIASGSNRPVKLVFEGNQVVTEIVASETPDKTVGVNVSVSAGCEAVVGSIFGSWTSLS